MCSIARNGSVYPNKNFHGEKKMGHFELEIRNGKINFDKALNNYKVVGEDGLEEDWDFAEFEKALERFANIQTEPFKMELWKQFNGWKQKF